MVTVALFVFSVMVVVIVSALLWAVAEAIQNDFEEDGRA